MKSPKPLPYRDQSRIPLSKDNDAAAVRLALPTTRLTVVVSIRGPSQTRRPVRPVT